MVRPGWQTAASALAGFLLGLALWWGLSETYAGVLAKSASPLLRLTEDPAVTLLRTDGKHIIVNRSDFPRTSARPGVPAHDLTFNIILLTTLFAANHRRFSNRNVAGFVGALFLLYLTHVLGVFVTVKSIYALQLGEWSRVHYGEISRNVWAGAAHFYRLVGLYAFAFAVWWLCSPDAAESSASRSQIHAKGKGRRKRTGK